jgi:hypothetical protein
MMMSKHGQFFCEKRVGQTPQVHNARTFRMPPLRGLKTDYEQGWTCQRISAVRGAHKFWQRIRDGRLRGAPPELDRSQNIEPKLQYSECPEQDLSKF